MKRYGNLYEKIYDMENLKLAHKNAKRGKGWYKEVKMVDENPEYYLTLLQEQLVNKTYHTSEYETFIKNDNGKEREIYKLPYFPDRICQWAIIQVIEPILIKRLTINTYSAIPKRGIHFGLKRLKNDLRKDPEGCKYCLKLDIKKYYPSINHTILKEQYSKLFKDRDLLWLLYEIIDSTNGDTGIPIGNYLSQYSGNFYLSSFDHWIKESKNVVYYHRYMDDIVILKSTKSELQQLKNEIENYLSDNLKLSIKDNWQVFPTNTRGIDFLGYRIFIKFILLRNSICKRFKIKMNKIEYKISNGVMMNYSEWCSVNSYKGWIIHCNAFRLYQKYIIPLLPYTDFYYKTFIKEREDFNYA